MRRQQKCLTALDRVDKYTIHGTQLSRNKREGMRCLQRGFTVQFWFSRYTQPSFAAHSIRPGRQSMLISRQSCVPHVSCIQFTQDPRQHDLLMSTVTIEALPPLLNKPHHQHTTQHGYVNYTHTHTRTQHTRKPLQRHAAHQGRLEDTLASQPWDTSAPGN